MTVRARAGLVIWVAVLLPVASGAWRRGGLAGPPLVEPGSWGGWAAPRSGPEAGFAVLGGMVVVLAWYLLAATSLAAAARLAGSRRMLSVAEVLTVPVLRRFLFAGLGLGLGLSPASLMVAHAEQAPVEVPAEGEEAPVMQRLADDDPAPTRPAPPGDPPPVWDVRAGDHLWSVASRSLEGARGGEVTDDEVAPYWRMVVEANRSRLADPANPDLVFPGQQLVLPPPPVPSPPHR